MKNNNQEPNNLHYMPIGMCIGIGVGVALGAAFENIPLWMCLGLSIGVGVGSLIDARQQKNADDKAPSDSEPRSEDEFGADSENKPDNVQDPKED